MYKKVFHRFLFCIFLFCSIIGVAQDLKGAYIKTAWVPNTITFTPIYEYSYTLTLLTDPSINVSRGTVTVSFGDNTSGTLSLATTTIISGTSVKTFTGSHIYAGPTPDGAYYAVEYHDTFRVANVKNVPASQTQSVYARSLIVANQLFWTKPSGTVTNFPPILGISENNIIYDPMFFRGSSMDSVSYSLFDYFNAGGYYIPVGAALSPTSGILTFPRDSIGLYTFNIKVIEWGKDAIGVRRPSRTTYVDFTLDITTTVGLYENETKNNFRIFPNPTDGRISIKTELNGLMRLNDMFGKDCGVYNLKQGTNELDLTSLAKGVYLCQIEYSQKIIYYKLVLR